MFIARGTFLIFALTVFVYVYADTVDGIAEDRDGGLTKLQVDGFGGETIGTNGSVPVVGALKNGHQRPKRECTDYGCQNGKCWAYCSIGAQWCYTTKSYSQSYRYVKCKSKDDCSCWWSCAGSCTV